ncbi:MAG: hypothetical protein WDN49_15615 [Acetobacteraceae bacterium]
MSVMYRSRWGHYIENTGKTPLRFLETFQEQLLRRYLAEPVDGADAAGTAAAHLGLDKAVMDALQEKKSPVVPFVISFGE